jgi:ubiquinone/menaquinone biosynthesis C-methylase UbiE
LNRAVAFFDSDTAYDAFMGRYSTRLAPLFADFAGVAAGVGVVDVGAGTGALTSELVRRRADVAAADPAPAFVAALRSRLPQVEVHEAPAERLPWPDGRFDAALAQLVVTFMSDAPAGIGEMRRVVRVGGTVAVCMWDRDDMEMLAAVQRTQQTLGVGGPMPEARTLYRTREEIESLFGDGFAATATVRLAVDSTYAGFEEFWEALAAGAGPAGAWARALEGESRDAARAELHRQLGGPSGSFTLAAAAWATRATRADSTASSLIPRSRS